MLPTENSKWGIKIDAQEKRPSNDVQEDEVTQSKPQLVNDVAVLNVEDHEEKLEEV